MTLYNLGSKPPQIQFQTGLSREGHYMWFRGQPFVAWNCDSHCNKRLRRELAENNGEFTCDQCGAVYHIRIDARGVTVIQSPSLRN